MTNDPVKKPNVKLAVPFLMVMDMEQSLRFYTEGLGFIIKMKWIPHNEIEWCWLEMDSAAIMLQEYKKESVPQVKRGEGVSVYFICEDALSLYHEFIAKGINAEEPFVGNNMWVTHLTDPDGYHLFFESTTDVPEGTTYSQWKK